MTIAPEAPAPPADTDATPVLDARRVRLMASKLLSRGDTAERVREYAAGREHFAYMWDSIADAMDALAASVPAQPSAPALEAVPS
jgi:hypothetical protein